MSVVAWKRLKDQRAVGASLYDAIGCGDEGAAAGGGRGLVPPAPAASSGLALSHSDSFLGTRAVGSFVLRIPENGSVVRLTKVSGPRGGRIIQRKRGKIHGLSTGAALRLQRCMLEVNQARVAESFFVSNTIPLIGGVPEFGWKDVRRFLKLWRQRFERRFPQHAAVWVKELTAKGSPHLHFVVVWAKDAPRPTVEEFKGWNDDAWADVVQSSHPKHRQVACNVKVLRSWEGAARYLSCYLGKGSAEDPRTEDSGKMWGLIGRKNLPIDWRDEVELGAKDGRFVQRQLLHLQRKKRTYWMVRTIFKDEKVGWSRVRQGKWPVSAGIMIGVYPESGFQKSIVLTAAQALDVARCYGVPVKRVVPRCCRTKEVPLWSMDEDSGKLEKCEAGEELHAFVSGWHHVSSSEVLRLVDYVKNPPIDRLTRCERRWAEEKTKGGG